jgi:catechol 2,3-dioxygenase-like lactoylglutathione lyase family enzyme
MKENIIGIQQVGVGIPDVQKAWQFYRQHFGMDIPVFQESAEAKLMTPYTGGNVHARSAVLAINLMGGSGLEIWQYTSRKTEPASFEVQLGDLGIFVTRIKSPDVKALYEYYKAEKTETIGGIKKDPNGNPYIMLKDPWGSLFQVVEAKDWFRQKEKKLSGGVCGSQVGVSNMDRSLKFYGDLLGFNKVVYDKAGVFEDFTDLPGGGQTCRRVLLERSVENPGAFSKLLGKGQIELIEVKGRSPKKIFENRYWGDMGFIHLCFDVRNMKELEENFKKHGYPFTVDSNSSFDMGEAAGHFSYIEDPDGTLIEFVETYRIPILKKIGWYLDVAKRDSTKTLPDWMLSAMRFTRVKD